MTPIEGQPLGELTIPLKSAPRGALVLAVAEGVVYLAYDGKKRAAFSLSVVPDMSSSLILDFSSDGRNGVYLLFQHAKADRTAEYAIAIFDMDGKFKSLQKLDINFLPMKFAVLGDGANFVVAGRHLNNQHPFTAIFDDRGQFLREVVLEKDTVEKWASDFETGKAKLPPPGPSVSGGPMGLYKSFLDRTDQGDVFLVRREDRLVYVIRPSGVARAVKLTSPAGAGLLAVKIAGNRIAAVYSVRTPPTFRGVLAVSNMDGKKLAEYSYDAPALGFGVVEYTPDKLILLGTPVFEEGRSMAFVEAVPAN
jgi:hypothetical protein